MNPLLHARASLRAGTALVLLAACAGCAAPKPTPAPVEIVIAPPPISSAAEPTESDVTITPGAAGSFGGAAGNAPHGITGIWGVGNHVFAVGPGMILRSEDRGLHFKRSVGPSGSPSVWGASADDVYVAGSRVVRSTDRGATWSDVGSLPGVAKSIWGSGPEDVYVVGGEREHPFIARSIDHGATWVEFESPFSGLIRGITGAGPHELLVVGLGSLKGVSLDPSRDSSSVFLRSTDSGRQWTSLPSFPAGISFTWVHSACFSAKGLFAATTYDLYFTPDLGRTWTLAQPVGAEVLALTCRGDEILVGGRNRKLFASHDGGATWIGDPIGALWTAPSLSSVQAVFVSEGGEVFVGFEGLYDKEQRGSLFRRSP